MHKVQGNFYEMQMRAYLTTLPLEKLMEILNTYNGK